jgi:hypothetical protein
VPLYDRPIAIEHGVSSVGCPDERTIGGAAASPLVGISMQAWSPPPAPSTIPYIRFFCECVVVHSTPRTDSIDNVRVPSIDRIAASSPFVCYNSSQSAFFFPEGPVENGIPGYGV